MPSVLPVVRPAVAGILLLAAVAVTGVVLYAFWPAGVLLGLALGGAAVFAVGAHMQRSALQQPVDEELAARLGALPVPEEEAAPAPRARIVVPEPVALPVQADLLYFTSDDDPDVAEARELVTAAVAVDPVRTDLERLKSDLGDDYRDFARAARLVVSTQYASAARLQRDLQLPYSRARRLLADLEQQHFVGPATGSLPRQVLLPKERLSEVEALLSEA